MPELDEKFRSLIETLRESEEQFRLLVEGIRDYAIFMLDPEGYVVSWNSGAETIKGYQAEEILGQHFSRFYPEKDIARRWPWHELKVAREVGRFEDEGWRLRKDGTMFWANVVITALYDREHRLRGFAKVTRDMTERRRVEALERADIRRTEFLAMLAHELRNPLAPIRNALGLIGPTRPDDATLEWSRAVIERQVGHLTRLVDDLLDVSRITANKIALQREPVEIAQVVSGAVEASQPLIQEKRQILEVHIPEEPVRVTGDLTRLSQVVLNLLNNAAKYTPEGGRIRLTVERQESEAVLRVRDTGMGIAANLLPEIFELFTQGERSLDRPEGGLGIGLTLVKRLVELHGGTVQASSEGPGLGTEMIVRLPLLAGDLPADSPKTYGSGRASAARRVLVVDDNRDATETMALLLELGDMRCTALSTGRPRSPWLRSTGRRSSCWTSGCPG